MSIFGEKFKELREEKELSQVQIAKDLGIDHSTISKWEKENKEPSYDILKKIANYFNVTIDYLLGNEDYIKKANTLKEVSDIKKIG